MSSLHPADFWLPSAAVSQWQALSAALADHVTPCQAEPAVWSGDDRRTWERAARACRSCPALGPCSAYAAAAGESGAVWGGRIR